VRFDAIYSSDLDRCRGTAEVIAAGTGVEVSLDRRLREIHTGLWEGLIPDQARHAYPKEFAEREDDVIGYPFPGGESFRALQVRVLEALDDILARRQEVVLIVAHLGVNRVILAHLKGLPLEGMFSLRQDYCDFEVVAVPEVS
jgi:broad specificity phosphatase PhoE